MERDGELRMLLAMDTEETELTLKTSAQSEVLEGAGPVVMNVSEWALPWNGHKYDIYYGESLGIATWQDAKKYCESLGGHLATITSQEENDAIWRFANWYWHEGGIFFGFTDEQEEGVWRNVTGEEVSYTNWHSGEPNNQDIQNYGQIYAEGDWDDSKFDYSKFICEWDLIEGEEEAE